jgi:hypothetical protein
MPTPNEGEMPNEGTQEKPGETPPTPASETPAGDYAAELAAARAETARTQAALKAANAESAERRVKLKELEEAEEARRQSELSELEKAQEQIEALKRSQADQQAATQSAMIKAEARTQAAMMGFNNPDDAFYLVNLDSVTVADGEVTGAKEALEALAKEKPYLLKPEGQRVAPGLGGGDGNSPSNNEVELTPRQKELAQFAKDRGHKLDDNKMRSRLAEMQKKAGRRVGG